MAVQARPAEKNNPVERPGPRCGKARMETMCFCSKILVSQTRRDVLRCGRASQQDFSHPPTRRETVATYWTKRISVDPEAHELLTRLSRQGKSAAASQCCIDSSRSCGLETEHLVLLRIWSDSHLHNTKENCEHNPSWLKLSKLGYPAALRMS